MFVLTKLLIFVNIFILIGLISASDKRQADDDMCKVKFNILCVKDVITKIGDVTPNVNRTLNLIEKIIFENNPNTKTIDSFVNYEMATIESHLPKSKYHLKFFLDSNIDKNDLNHILSEAHYAISYYYNSVKDILSMNDIFAFTVDLLLRQIQDSLRYEIICRYRSILNVYSYKWPLINEVQQIKFSETKYRSSPSLTHNVRSIVIVRLLREWMNRLHLVMTNFEYKYH
ncbi:unnamed protein product [Adineta steineri]|uniref:Uncharacterized protein n=1 Tax=Adineta steineri TaxID=433720 RepID=A0A819KZ28_9BILA|nr:unnamed protein product [Adineta steineri]CAF3956578.1 unnamed protein product [Adineta steineri]